MENYKNKQFINFTLQAVLSRVMKSHALLIHPTWAMNHPYVQNTLPLSHLAVILVIR